MPIIEEQPPIEDITFAEWLTRLFRQARDEDDLITSERVRWLNVWESKSYQKNDMVRDGFYTMIANKLTSDRPAPQSIGVPESDIGNDAMATIVGTPALIHMTHTYTMLKDGWFQEMKIKMPGWDNDTDSRLITTNITNNKTNVYDNVIMAGGDWVVLRTDNTPLLKGHQIKLDMYIYKNSAGGSSFDGDWIMSQNNTAPGVGFMGIDSFAAPTLLTYNYQDFDGTDRQAELEAVTIGSFIELAEAQDGSRFIYFVIDAVNTAGGFVSYTVSELDRGLELRANQLGTHEIVDTSTSAPVDYYKISSYRPAGNPSWATITSDLKINGVDQAVTDAGFAMDLTFHEGAISLDWDLMAFSG